VDVGRIHRWPIVIRCIVRGNVVRINRVPFNPMDRLMSMLRRRVVAIMRMFNGAERAMKREWKSVEAETAAGDANFMDVPGAPAACRRMRAAAIICAGGSSR